MVRHSNQLTEQTCCRPQRPPPGLSAGPPPAAGGACDTGPPQHRQLQRAGGRRLSLWWSGRGKFSSAMPDLYLPGARLPAKLCCLWIQCFEAFGKKKINWRHRRRQRWKISYRDGRADFAETGMVNWEAWALHLTGSERVGALGNGWGNARVIPFRGFLLCGSETALK